MTTPTPAQTEPTFTAPTLSPDTSAGTADELESYAQHVNLPHDKRRVRALDGAETPPAAGPRDLTGLDATMMIAQSHEAWYWSHPDWHAIRDIRQRVDAKLALLNERAKITPQAAIDAARITTLAAEIICQHAARVRAHLDAGGHHDSPGGEAMHSLVRAAEDHAVLASGVEILQALDTPRLLNSHVRKLTKELRRAEANGPEQQPDPAPDYPDTQELESALAIGATADPDLAEASELMTSLSEMTSRARRARHRLTLDVRLHGMVGTAQLRSFEMISGIARAVMHRYDNRGQGTSGRRHIASIVHFYAEQSLERLRGTLDEGTRRDFDHYEANPPERYMSTLFEESRTVNQELRAKHITPQERADLQIRHLLAWKEIAAAGGDPGWGTRATFPPSDWVAGQPAGDPVEMRLNLTEALRQRVQSNPFHRHAHFFNAVADRLAQEVAGPPELTDQALEAELNADQVRSVAQHVVEQGTLPSPLALSEDVELNLTHAQAERALAVLQTFNVVGPPNGLKPRETLTVSRNDLQGQLELLEQRLPNLLNMQHSAATVPITEVQTTSAQPDTGPTPESPAKLEEQAQASGVPSPTVPAESAPAATTQGLPRRDRSAERRHPGNLATPRPSQADTPDEQDLAKLFDGQEDRLVEVSQTLKAGTEARTANHPAPPETASPPAMNASVDEAQHNAQQAQPTVGVGVR